MLEPSRSCWRIYIRQLHLPLRLELKKALMKTKKKIILIVVGVLVALAIVGFSLNQTSKNLVSVQTGKVVKQDISSYVTASGEVRPKTFANIGANAFGRITKLLVKEGDKVKRRQI